MRIASRTADIALPRKPIAACMAALFMLSSPWAAAAPTTWTVNSCSEGNSGDIATTTGTLRFAAANAASGDTINMAGLTCSTISLQTGSIVFNQTDVTVAGPGKDKLTITGMYNGALEHDRIFTHNGNGRFEVYNLSVSDGYIVNRAYHGFAAGGCMFSAGDLVLANVSVHNCRTNVLTGFSNGGGIYAKQAITLKYCDVLNNTADSVNYDASGGGAYSLGSFFAKYSTISGNAARSATDHSGYGGGVTVQGNLTITHSTVSNNFAGVLFGGINSYSRYGFASVSTNISDSTISGNTAAVNIGAGVYSNLSKVNIYNSTIAFNGSGLFVQNRGSGSVVKLVSTLIANNNDYDFGIRTNVTVTGNHNLVRSTSVTMPPDTLTGCPLLGPLAFNGGPTRTHALFSGSPAIDAGSNQGQFKQDQRGLYADPKPYPFPRASGAATDIGAYEVQQSEIIFNTEFEGCT